MLSIRARIAVVAGLVVIGLAAPSAAVKRRAFVTSVAGNGNLASWPLSGGGVGLAAGDNICRARAFIADLPNPGSYYAWLSTASTDAYCHVQGQTGKKATGCVGTATGAGPWYRYDGVGRFSGSIDELTDFASQAIYQPIRFDELGNELSGTQDGFWTSTLSTGEAGADTCSGWVVGTSGAAGSTGLPDRTWDDWTAYLISACDNERRLLCLEGGTSEVTPVPWVPAALAFTTSVSGSGDLSTWPEAGGESGLAAADNICQSLATAAHLPSPESFVAWLSTTATDAGDRLTLTGTPIRRVDGFRVADSKADLLATGADNSLHVDQEGRYLSYTNLWTGTAGDGTATVDHCDGWSSAVATDDGHTGFGNAAYSEVWTQIGAYDCDLQHRLACFSNVEVLFWDGFDLSENTERWSTVAP